MRFMEFYVNDEYTKEMEDWFVERTDRHIGLVKKYAGLIEDYDSSRFEGLKTIADKHDASKYEDVEKIPYIFISWNYHCKDIGKEFKVPDGIMEKMDKASLHHVKNNKHHPEFYDDDESITSKNKDESPDESGHVIDATSMPEIYIAEMVADWMAMGEELKNSAKDWADKNVNVKWRFTDDQKDLIYELINNVKDKK